MPGGAAAKQAAAPAETFALIGDTPYGAAHITGFSSDITAINADPDVSLVARTPDVLSWQHVAFGG